MSDKENKWYWFKNNSIIKKLKTIKHIEIYVAIVTIGLFLGVYFMINRDTDEVQTKITTQYSISTLEYMELLEDKLSSVLSKVSGAGNVKVVIVAHSSGKLLYATSTEEKVVSSNITGGATSTTTKNSEPIIVSVQGESSPIVIQEFMPEISGVLVVAEGAEDVNVRLALMTAVQAILNVPTSNVQILVGNK